MLLQITNAANTIHIVRRSAKIKYEVGSIVRSKFKMCHVPLKAQASAIYEANSPHSGRNVM